MFRFNDTLKVFSISIFLLSGIVFAQASHIQAGTSFKGITLNGSIGADEHTLLMFEITEAGQFEGCTATARAWPSLSDNSRKEVIFEKFHCEGQSSEIHATFMDENNIVGIPVSEDGLVSPDVEGSILFIYTLNFLPHVLREIPEKLY